MLAFIKKYFKRETNKSPETAKCQRSFLLTAFIGLLEDVLFWKKMWLSLITILNINIIIFVYIYYEVKLCGFMLSSLLIILCMDAFEAWLKYKHRTSCLKRIASNDGARLRSVFFQLNEWIDKQKTDFLVLRDSNHTKASNKIASNCSGNHQSSVSLSIQAIQFLLFLSFLVVPMKILYMMQNHYLISNNLKALKNNNTNSIFNCVTNILAFLLANIVLGLIFIIGRYISGYIIIYTLCMFLCMSYKIVTPMRKMCRYIQQDLESECEFEGLIPDISDVDINLMSFEPEPMIIDEKQNYDYWKPEDMPLEEGSDSSENSSSLVTNFSTEKIQTLEKDVEISDSSEDDYIPLDQPKLQQLQSTLEVVDPASSWGSSAYNAIWNLTGVVTNIMTAQTEVGKRKRGSSMDSSEGFEMIDENDLT